MNILDYAEYTYSYVQNCYSVRVVFTVPLNMHHSPTLTDGCLGQNCVSILYVLLLRLPYTSVRGRNVELCCGKHVFCGNIPNAMKRQQ